MSEKKQVLYDLRIAYSGPFVIEDFYADIDSWIHEHGFEKEPKKNLEQVTKNGKKIQWHIEVQSHLDDLNHGIVVLRVYMENVQEVTIVKKGKKIKINNGDVLINIDGFVDSHFHSQFWQVKPVYYFFRTIIDRFIVHVYSEKYDGTVAGQCHQLYKEIRSFFELQKYKYA